MNDTVNLGEELGEQPGTPDEQEPTYPQVTLSNPDLINLPNSGKSVIEHEVVRRTHEKDHKGKPKHHVTLRIKSIRPMGRKRNISRPYSSQSAMQQMMDSDES